MIVADGALHIFHRLSEILFAVYIDEQSVEVLRSGDVILGGGIRHDHAIIEVDERARALGRQDADDLEGTVLHLDALAEAVTVREKLLIHFGTDEHDARASLHVFVGIEGSFLGFDVEYLGKIY